jgi:hypothetical protein
MVYVFGWYHVLKKLSLCEFAMTESNYPVKNQWGAGNERGGVQDHCQVQGVMQGPGGTHISISLARNYIYLRMK